MYYPIGWNKVLKLDTRCEQEQCNIISIQANHERELFFILTTRSIHVWYHKPAIEIVCHKRSNESIESIGLNRAAVWKTDSSVIVVATEHDQLLFYHLKRRVLPSSATTFLLPSSQDGDSIYRLRHDTNSLKSSIFKRKLELPQPDSESIPALTIFSFGKLDLSTVGVSCLMAAEEELIVGAKNGDMYGVLWEGNVDEKFPWSLGKESGLGASEYASDLKFSSVLAGFALVFNTGRIGFLPLRSSQEKLEDSSSDSGRSDRDQAHKYQNCVNYFPGVVNAVCTEINHKYRLIAFGLKQGKIIVCNIADPNSSLVINHELELQVNKFPHDPKKLGAIKCMRYSPDGFALMSSWEGGHFAIWSVFGSLLFCTLQWQLGSELCPATEPIRISCLAWGREGYNLWLCHERENPIEQPLDNESNGSLPNGTTKSSTGDELLRESTSTSLDVISQDEEVSIISLAHSALSSSPHLTCSSDSILLLSEDRLYVGPSIPQKDKFDHWFVIDLPQRYLSNNYPIRYATVDRECSNLAIAGSNGFALYSIESGRWKLFTKKSQENDFTVYGDIIWWNDYLVLSCYNHENDNFELRAYPSNGRLSNDQAVVQVIAMEIIKMSIFENRLLVLYSDGTLGMFMLNLRRRPTFKKPQNSSTSRSSSITEGSINGEDSDQTQKSALNDGGILNFSNPLRNASLLKEISLQIAPIENLVISNLQANPYCISSIALTKLHFKNNRDDDSILLNSCGKLFLLEREVSNNLSSSSPTSDLSSSVDLNDLSLESNHTKSSLTSDQIETKMTSAKRLSNSIHFASALLKNTTTELSASSHVTFKAVSVIATNVEQFWISPEISEASEMSYFRKSLWLSCGGSNNYLQVWLPLLNDKNDPPTDLYVPDRIMLPIRCDIYPLAIRSSAPDKVEPDDAIVLGAESEILYKDSRLFDRFPYSTVKRQCRVYLHRVLRELLLSQHLGYYARKIAESCQSLPYFAHCFELLLHEVLEEEATSPVPLPDPMLPQIVRFIKEFPVYLETVVNCARKSELSMWSHLFDERAVGNPKRLFQECLEKQKLDTAASCLIILQSFEDRTIVSQRMVKELIKAAKDDPKFNYLIEDLESFLSRAELDYMSNNNSSSSSPSA